MNENTEIIKQEELTNTIETPEVRTNDTVLETKEALVLAQKEERANTIKANSNTTTVKLPSNGLINPAITEVTLKRMTTLQSKTLFTSKDPNFLTTLIMDCIVEPTNITTADLHPNDIIYLIFVLRHISSPKNVEQEVYCTNRYCEKKFNSVVRIPELSVKYATPSAYEYSCELPDANDVIQFKILSEAELVNSDKIAERKIKQYEIEDGDWFKLISKLACMITAKNDIEFKKFDEKVEYLESLSAYDFSVFNKAYNDIITSFGLERTYIDTCPHCGDVVEVQAYIAPDFFHLV